MEMRDRLIEVLKGLFEFHIDDPFCVPDENDFADDLLKNGVIVPPCKVGDKVYWFNMGGKLTEAAVVDVFQARVEGGFEYSIPFTEIGKTVFLTKEEAEKALKECEGNE